MTGNAVKTWNVCDDKLNIITGYKIRDSELSSIFLIGDNEDFIYSILENIDNCINIVRQHDNICTDIVVSTTEPFRVQGWIPWSTHGYHHNHHSSKLNT